MAIVGTDEDENKPTSSSSANAHSTLQAPGASGGFVGGSGQGAGGVSAPTPTTPAGGGGYANLSQYLAANQGAGATTGQAGENVVNQDAKNEQSAQNNYETGAFNEVNAAGKGLDVDQNVMSNIQGGTPGVNQDVLNKISGGAYSYTAPKDVAGATDQTLQGLVKAGSGGKYSGPTDFTGYSYSGPASASVSYNGPQTIGDLSGATQANQTDTMGKLDTLTGDVRNAQGGQAGVSALLKNAYQQPNYSKGENSLDAFLVGGSPQGQSALSQAGQIGANTQKSYQGLQSLIQGGLDNNKSTAAYTNAAYAKAIQDAKDVAGKTQDTYSAAAKAAQDQSAANSATAGDWAKKAQAEIDARAKSLADSQKPVLPPTQPPPVQPPPVQPPPPNKPPVLQQVTSKLGDLGTDIYKGAGSLINNLTPGAYQQNAITSSLLGSLGKTAPVKAATQTALNARTNVNNAIKSNVGNVVSGAKNVTGNLVKSVKAPQITQPKKYFYKGGEVPSYSNLRKMLRK